MFQFDKDSGKSCLHTTRSFLRPQQHFGQITARFQAPAPLRSNRAQVNFRVSVIADEVTGKEEVDAISLGKT